MNDDQKITRDRVQQATSRTMPPNEPLDHETSALRDGWLALGRALETAGQDFDHETVAASLQAKLIDQTQRVQPAAASASRTWWPAILGTALALTMVLAAVRSLPLGAWIESSDDPLLVTNSHEGSPAPARWSDPLDDEIDEATVEVQALAAQSSGLDDSLWGLSQQLESMSDELSRGSL